MNKVPMTHAGSEALKLELQQLKGERPKISKAIEEARAHGDLRENAEYHAAKEQQGLMEARIKYIESQLSLAQIIDVKSIKNEGKVIFGATVHLVNTHNDEEIAYQIVGEDEFNVKLGRISINSPIARALIGKEESDVVTVQTPTGKVEYEIVKVEYI